MSSPYPLAYAANEPPSPITALAVLRVVNACCIGGAILLVVMSPWPGYANSCFALLLIPVIALLGLTWLLAGARALRVPRVTGSPTPIQTVATAPVIVLLTLAMLQFYVPRRIGFLCCRAQFAANVNGAPVSGYLVKRFDRRLGIYHVDARIADPRGGVYFLTGTGADGFGPDTMSYGFAYRPNPQGTPFGNAKYKLGSLGGGWFWFAASNDW